VVCLLSLAADPPCLAGCLACSLRRRVEIGREPQPPLDRDRERATAAGQGELGLLGFIVG
jgi:hypothetical protein